MPVATNKPKDLKLFQSQHPINVKNHIKRQRPLSLRRGAIANNALVDSNDHEPFTVFEASFADFSGRQKSAPGLSSFFGVLEDRDSP